MPIPKNASAAKVRINSTGQLGASFDDKKALSIAPNVIEAKENNEFACRY